VARKAVKGILAAIGDTPLVELDRLFPDLGFRLFAKLEKFNPGGSVKDRSALTMLQARILDGKLRPGVSTVVESSSGNLAIGIAQLCRYYGLRFVCVVDAKTTEQNLAILRAYQAEVEVVTERDPATGEYLPVRLARVRELVRAIPHAYWPNQYANPLNPRAHENTMREIVEALDGRVDHLFCATSTFGTLRGCARYVRRQELGTELVAVDAVGSVLFCDRGHRRLIPGHGASVRPALLDASLVDRVVHVSDLDCVVGCRRLTSREGILAGGSSGATVAAVQALRDRVPAGASCVLIFPDGGDRYLDTIYSDEWVARHFGEVSHLWKDPSPYFPAGG
jgi:N-(2-amino-2-carboxyethyl)-L-glutamate synthase